jgi:hypothetical protein
MCCARHVGCGCHLVVSVISATVVNAAPTEPIARDRIGRSDDHHHGDLLGSRCIETCSFPLTHLYSPHHGSPRRSPRYLVSAPRPLRSQLTKLSPNFARPISFRIFRPFLLPCSIITSPPLRLALVPCRCISLAPQIKAYSGGLYKALKPLANAYANVVGHRKMGLKYDDLITEERDDIQRVSTACARRWNIFCGIGGL